MSTTDLKNVLIINAHQYYPFSEGKLNAALIDKAITMLEDKGYNTRVVTMSDGYDVEEQLALHQWADIVFLQTPSNWMGVSWSFKKYMDEVYTAGMGGALCVGDGRTAESPKKNYGKGGTLTNTKYMMSLTFNAPEEAFNDPEEFFDGKSIDDLMFPMHMNFKFFGMKPMETFACFDVMKNADVENDFKRFETHINKHF
ncbi:MULTISPECIES: NAD(P)H-dependent oxidoreductase [Pseudoalteromonas]|uniref:Flavodoxin family protein n=1 Tax=Pseudoalteromonas maricaloris TaxID=184924 RepID=A0A8I2H4T2_9GAMM|nr:MULTISPECIES: NAD(P)H-dependent oxidoreductase [Pseudoalteromonas]AUJ72381.1 Modulator of drug activity B [Pseudoalteromonas sp. NC201]KID33725.1 flavodoxin [Pseudoalteromonas flavipulchra NCIMB 2033 = ATCC BAA-314]KJZ03167.1 flavodoxin [Pseudoalteromonas piscicida]MBD0782089.1 flavodoxin family protein [Pseudoalteromonas flavipulchra]MBE0375802.1 modulator of drug activity B [Pseudoalteromonas flavipulchra NCIMB 2033 = ATCC BAA-314]